MSLFISPSIPKLKLLANFILSNLTKAVVSTLLNEFFFKISFCWEDSTILLGWLKNVTQFYTFAQNRVFTKMSAQIYGIMLKQLKTAHRILADFIR